MKMNLKNIFKKADIEEYKDKIKKIDEQIKQLNKTKKKWQTRLRNKLKE
jgi:DNA-binding ferritin-like protein